jgi:hypothetical protein
MEERAVQSSAHVVRFMVRLGEHLRPTFPQYAGALMDQIHGKKMTNDRWNRVAAILSSLAALPGTTFKQDEHDARNPALSAVVVAQRMASATFGGRNDVERCYDFAVYLSDEISPRLQTGNNGQEKAT